MRIPAAVFLFLVSCVPAHDLEVCADVTAGLMDSGPSFHRGPRENVIPDVDTCPSPEQTQSDWESYLEYLGKLKMDLPLDGFKVRPFWVQANATFRIIYQFHIGEDDHPEDIQLVEGEKQIDADAAKACLARWTLSGLMPNKKYFLVMTWEHIKGYTMLALTGDQMSLSVRLPTGRSRQRRGAATLEIPIVE